MHENFRKIIQVKGSVRAQIERDGMRTVCKRMGARTQISKLLNVNVWMYEMEIVHRVHFFSIQNSTTFQSSKQHQQQHQFVSCSLERPNLLVKTRILAGRCCKVWILGTDATLILLVYTPPAIVHIVLHARDSAIASQPVTHLSVLKRHTYLRYVVYCMSYLLLLWH